MQTWSLGIETSGDTGCVTLDDGQAWQQSIELPVARRFAASLAPAVAELMARAGILAQHLDSIVVGTGPGSYTGMRVGASLAAGLARGCGAKLLGVPSLDGWAASLVGTHQGLLVPMVDARRDRVYWAGYRLGPESWERSHSFGIARLADFELGEPFAWCARGLESCEESLRARGGTRLEVAACPPAAALIAIAREGRAGPAQPLYLKATEAEERAGKVVVDPGRGA